MFGETAKKGRNPRKVTGSRVGTLAMARLATPWQASWTTKAVTNPAAVRATEAKVTPVNSGMPSGWEAARWRGAERSTAGVSGRAGAGGSSWAVAGDAASHAATAAAAMTRRAPRWKSDATLASTTKSWT